jgi:Tol biopolymer transport system component
MAPFQARSCISLHERPAVSPDGKYVAYVQRDGNDYSLWIRQTTTASNVQIVAAQPGAVLAGATVTPDGSFVDFVRIRREREITSELWRVAFLGGTPHRLVDRVDTPVGWSSDGQRMAFVRVDVAPTGTSSALVIADADGSHPRELAIRRLPSLFGSLRNTMSTGAIPVRPDWSPDGRSIAVLGANVSPSGVIRQMVVIDVTSGSERVVPVAPSAGLLGLAWLDAESLVLNHVAEDGSPAQLWRIAYPTGQLSKITNDLSRYVGVSVTADRGSLVTAQYVARSSIWVGDGNGRKGSETLSIVRSRGIVTWAGERLLYMTDGRIMSVVPGRGTPEEIIEKGAFPSATSDGRTIVFSAAGESPTLGLWKADAGGRNRVQLVSGVAAQAAIGDNDRLVIFISIRGGQQTVWTVPIDVGMPTEIVKNFATGVSVSPDGRSLLFESRADREQRSLVICELPACTGRRTMVPPDGSQFRWGPDGRSVAYRDAATQANLRVQPLDGSPPHQLTHFPADRTITSFGWSHDGKRLTIARELVTNDIVLFKASNGDQRDAVERLPI